MFPVDRNMDTVPLGYEKPNLVNDCEVFASKENSVIGEDQR